QHSSTAHAAPAPSEYAPPPKRPDTNESPVKRSQEFGASDNNSYAQPRNEAEDMLASARNKLKPANGRASDVPGDRFYGGAVPAGNQAPNIGIKDRLKATGANMLRSRPKANRTSPPSSGFSSPPQSIDGGRPRGPIHRPGPLSAAELKAGHDYNSYVSAQLQQTANQQASFSEYANQNPQVASYRNPSVAANIPPTQAQSRQGHYPQRTFQHHMQAPLQTLAEERAQMYTPGQQQSQAPSGYSSPGHKQPRSRDRMRSTLHYDNFASLNMEAAKAAQVGASNATLSTQPPPPQQPMGHRMTAPNYSQQQYQPDAQTYGQATFVDPGAQPKSTTYYSGKPLSAAQARNQQQQQQQQQAMPAGGYYPHPV
ncbi:hypothetical protein EV175_005786, partial [Coemansia sp. RSA 1933]